MNAANKSELNHLVNRIEKDAMRNAYSNVQDVIEEKQELIQKLLTSKESYNIMYQTYGPRFVKLWEKRQSLQREYYRLNNLWCEVEDLIQETYK